LLLPVKHKAEVATDNPVVFFHRVPHGLFIGNPLCGTITAQRVNYHAIAVKSNFFDTFCRENNLTDKKKEGSFLPS
jgi:hypothetical protein